MVYSPKVEVTGTIPDMRVILRLWPRKQKEAKKVKSDTKKNGEEAAAENKERDVASEAKE